MQQPLEPPPVLQQRLELPALCCWTGRVAVWAPFGQQQPQTAPQQLGPGLPPLKTAARGVWLRSEQGGVLTVQWRAAAAPPLLTFTLRSSQQLVHAPLAPGGFAFRLLCPAHGAPPPAAGGSSGHLLFLSLPLPGAAGSTQQPALGASTQQGQQRTFAVHFDTVQAGRECGALLEAIQQRKLVTAAPPPQPRPPPPALPAPAAGVAQEAALLQGRAAAAAAAGGAGPGLKGLEGSSMGWGAVTGSNAAEAAAAEVAAAAGWAAAPEDAGRGGAAAQQCSAVEGLFGFMDEPSLEAAIRAAQADPAFEAYVGLWEQAVERVEALLGPA